MDRKTFTIILAVALIASFFLPFSAGVSAFDEVQSKNGDWQKYLLLIFPICGLLLLMGELNKGNYIVSRSLLVWLPLLTILYFIFIGPLIKGADFGSIFKYIGKGYGAGLWIAIVSSLVLAFYNPPAK
ncbi:MAG: hypothetical protein LH619_07750 [Chitinophagaceae bacterium]|nr:hypothetical protein [Chitinophagaceae bacterium]